MVQTRRYNYRVKGETQTVHDLCRRRSSFGLRRVAGLQVRAHGYYLYIPALVVLFDRIWLQLAELKAVRREHVSGDSGGDLLGLLNCISCIESCGM